MKNVWKIKEPVKIRMYKMNVAGIGRFPVISNGWTGLKRPTVLYYAVNGGSSVFWLVRPKDCDILRKQGYTIKSITVPRGCYPISFTGENILQYRHDHVNY